jgi:hypothetical protein
VQQPLRPGALVQVVDVLGDQEKVTRPFDIEPRQRPVRGIRLYRAELRPPRIVELVDECGIAAKGLGCADVLDPVPFPQSVGTPEGGEAALRGNTRPSERRCCG